MTEVRKVQSTTGANPLEDSKKLQVFKMEVYHTPDEFTVVDVFIINSSTFIDADKTEPIKLNVRRRGSRLVQFKIKKYTPLRKLMTAYCDRVHLPMAAVRFQFDGQAIDESDTPLILKMEEGDTIEVYQRQTWANYTSTVNTQHPNL